MRTKTETKSDAESFVLAHAAAAPAEAAKHMALKLSLETDPSDVYGDMQRKVTGFLVIDTRSPEAYARGHVPGSLNLWHRAIDAKTTAALPKDTLLVAYCTGVGCNASTKGALKLAKLGFRVKEMIGGLNCWREEGYPVETE